MKKIIIAILAVSSVLTGCKKENVPSDKGVGMLSLGLTGNDEFTVVSKSEDGTSVDVSGFSVVIDGLGGAYHNEWKAYSDMPSVLELSSGEYTITATSPVTADSQWGGPLFKGEEKFSIEAGATTSVDVECTVSNVKVSVSLAEGFETEIPDYEITVTEVMENGKSLVWGKDEVAAGTSGYFSPVSLEVKVKGYRWDSSDDTPSVATSVKTITGVTPAKHYILNISANTTGKGGVSLTVDPTLDDLTEDITVPGFEEVPVEGGDEPDTDPDDPSDGSGIVMEWPSNPDFAPVVIGETDVNLTITVPAGIKAFIVNVSDNFKPAVSLITTGGVDYIDLINDTQVIGILSGMDSSMPLGEELKGQTSVDFSLTSLVNLIGTVGSPGDSYEFSLDLTDANDARFTKTLTFLLMDNQE